ncbi:MAG: hypothetical protein ACJAVO_000460 [Parvibaculaceae bacterium]|jgi:hypothetical protein
MPRKYSGACPQKPAHPFGNEAHTYENHAGLCTAPMPKKCHALPHLHKMPAPVHFAPKILRHALCFKT